MTNSLVLDGTEYMEVERNGFRQRVPVNSVADYQSPALVTQAATIASAPVVAKVALGHADTGGGVVSWANPETVPIVIQRVAIDVTTIATSAATVDIGVHASSPTTSNDTLLDGLDVHSATGLFDNLTSPGTDGLPTARLAVGGYVTASKASGACAGLVGNLYITYHRI